MEASQWPNNLGSERDWGFRASPNPRVNGRSIPMNMGKVLGGGSSINVMAWARGHKNDWDFFPSQVDDPSWNYASLIQGYIQTHRRLAWRTRPPAPGGWRAGIRTLRA